MKKYTEILVVQTIEGKDAAWPLDQRLSNEKCLVVLSSPVVQTFYEIKFWINK